MPHPADVPSRGVLRSINVGAARPLSHDGTTVRTAIDKRPVDGPVRVAADGLRADEQADRRVHGGPDQAVYAYDAAAYAWWSRELGRTLEPGTFGENLTVEGVGVDAAPIGAVWRIGPAQLRVRGPRIPCHKLGVRMGDRSFPARFAAAGRPGAYLAVLQPGEIQVGDAVVLAWSPDHGFTIARFAAAYHGDRSELAAMADPAVVAHLPEGWVEWSRRALARQRRA